MGRRKAVWATLMLWAVAACGGSDPIGPDASLAEFVGDWDATALMLSSPVTPDSSVDLIELGSTFSINIQPSGTYTAILVFRGAASTEIGTIRRSGGNTVILDRTFPSPSTEISTYVFEGSDRLILDGDTEFDFNLDGIPDQALAHFELARR